VNRGPSHRVKASDDNRAAGLIQIKRMRVHGCNLIRVPSARHTAHSRQSMVLFLIALNVLAFAIEATSPTFARSALFGGGAEAEYGADIEFRLIL
jgi:hypothetical protein